MTTLHLNYFKSQRIRNIAVAISLTLSNAATAFSAEAVKADVVRESKPISTESLVQCIAPELRSGKAIEIKHAFKPLPSSPADAGSEGYTGKAELTQTSVRQIRINGKQVYVVVATFNALEDNSTIGGQVVVLAFIDAKAGKLSLIDAVDVASDRFCGFATESVLHFGMSSDAVVIENSHFNSSEYFCDLLPVTLLNNRSVALCQNLPFLYNAKNGHSSLAEEAHFIVGKASGTAFKPLSLSIKATCKKFDQNNGDKILSTNEKCFLIPLTQRGKVYFVNKNAKELAALKAFVAKSGFDAP